MDIKDPKNRLTQNQDGTISFDGSPDQLIALIIDDVLEKVTKERLERVPREGYCSVMEARIEQFMPDIIEESGVRGQ